MQFGFRADRPSYPTRIVRITPMGLAGWATGPYARRLYLKAAPTHVEMSVSVLKELFTLWDSRASSYGDFLFASALAKTTDGIWKNVFTSLQPMHKAEKQGEFKHDYGDFIISRGLFSLRDAKATLT